MAPAALLEAPLCWGSIYGGNFKFICPSSQGGRFAALNTAKGRYNPTNAEKSGAEDLNSLHLGLRPRDTSLILCAYQY